MTAPVFSNPRGSKHLSNRLSGNPNLIHGIASPHMVWAYAICFKHGAPNKDSMSRLELGRGTLVGTLPPAGDRPGTCMLAPVADPCAVAVL